MTARVVCQCVSVGEAGDDGGPIVMILALGGVGEKRVVLQDPKTPSVTTQVGRKSVGVTERARCSLSAALRIVGGVGCVGRGAGAHVGEAGDGGPIVGQGQGVRPDVGVEPGVRMVPVSVGMGRNIGMEGVTSALKPVGGDLNVREVGESIPVSAEEGNTSLMVPVPSALNPVRGNLNVREVGESIPASVKEVLTIKMVPA